MPSTVITRPRYHPLEPSPGTLRAMSRLDGPAHDAHFRLHEVGLPAGRGRILASAGVRGAPDLAPGLRELVAAVSGRVGRVLDLTASAGAGVYAAAPDAPVTVLEPSAAGVRAATLSFQDDPAVSVLAGLPWDAPRASHDVVLLAPPADRGTERVLAELRAAADALRSAGEAYAVLHKDLGAKRYERAARSSFGSVEVVARERGWRVSRLSQPVDRDEDAARLGTETVPWLEASALGRRWYACPGVFAGGRLDKGTATLLRALLGVAPGADEEALAGALRDAKARTGGEGVAREAHAVAPAPGAELRAASVLDLGCGAGHLAWAALELGARAVTALDDDLGAVRSTTRNLAPDSLRAGREARVLHSDLDAALEPDARFDVVLMNPPFHLGKATRVGLGRAFIETARLRLREGGWLALVANEALPYEAELERWARWETVADAGAFKVLRAWR